MMADGPDRVKGLKKIWIALTAFAVIATGIGTIFCLQAVQDDQARKRMGAIIRQIEHGDKSEKRATINGLYTLTTPAELAQVFPYLLQAMKDESEMVRESAATIVGGLFARIGRNTRASENNEPTIRALCPKAAEALAVLLDDSSPIVRARAAESLGSVAEIGNLDAPPSRLVACLDDQDESVRAAAANALVEYRQGPELVVPLALPRISSESPKVSEALNSIFRHLRFEPSVLPLLIDGLSSENTDVCLNCTAAINHMGRDAGPALPFILNLLRKELRTPHALATHTSLDIIGMASGAIGELWPDGDPLPGTVELLCEVLKQANEPPQVSDPNQPAAPAASAEALAFQREFRQAEAAWSLGILGGSAASAVPLLLATFEAAPEASDNLRAVIAEALVEISRGTPDEDRVIASLAKAWKTAPKQQKTVFTRALRSLGPKSEQLVPALRQMPPDETRSQIRRVRYPRSGREEPVRE
jgi:HEAT repeat protein